MVGLVCMRLTILLHACSRPRPRVGRNELKSLMDSAAPTEQLQHMGSMASLSPMRTPAGLRETLGADKVDACLS